MQTGIAAAQTVIAAFHPLLTTDQSSDEEFGRSIPLPTFSHELVRSVCDAALLHFTKVPIVLDINGPLYVIGDVHGNVVDLLRILKVVGIPPKSRLLFLGDYVDRGEYSVEVVTLLFSLVVLHPTHVFLLRGNHEYSEVNRTYGFMHEVLNQYDNRSLFDEMNEVFSWLPVAAIINEGIFCVHGGMSEHIRSLRELRQIRRPIFDCDFQPVADLVWSDPDSHSDTPRPNGRGLGIQFGPKSLEIFLSGLGLRTMVRAHQCVGTGISKFGEQLYTVFSCSGYEGQDNRCGLILIDGESDIDCFSLPAIKQHPRSQATLRKYSLDDMTAKSVLEAITAKMKEGHAEDEGEKKSEERGKSLMESGQSKSEVSFTLPLLGPSEFAERLKSSGSFTTLPVLADLKDRRLRRRTRPARHTL
jgi:protein phosphatase